MTKRILYTCLLLISVFTFPVWLSGILALLGIIVFRTYVEAVLIVFLYESVFAPFVLPFPFIATGGLFVVVVIVEYIRPYLRK